MINFYYKYEPLLNLNDSKYNIIALTGGRGSLKTGHVLRGVLQASLTAKKKTCFFRETKETLSNSLKAELDGIIDEEFSNRGFNSTNEAITARNGSYMFFKGLKEVNTAAIENLKGIASTTDFFVVDEAQAVSKAVWDVLIPTLRKKGCVLVVIYNRISKDLPVEQCLFLDYDTMSAPAGTYFIEVNYPEIQHLGLLSEQFIQRAELVKQNKPDEYEQYYLNVPNDYLFNTVTKHFNQANVRQLKYIDDIDLHLSCDFNVGVMCWHVAHKDDNKAYFIDEICLENTTTRDIVREFIDRYKNHKGKIIINGDASGDYRRVESNLTNYVQIKNILKSEGKFKDVEVKIRSYNPPIKNRVQAWNAKILTDSGERCIFIDPKCKWLLYNIHNLRYKDGTDDKLDIPTHVQIKTNKDLKYLSHPFDSASYLVEFYWPVV